MKTSALARRVQSGITLIEALIALLLLSGAALGYAALQVRGLSSNAGAMWRSKAALLAYEMSDRMRANRLAVVAGSYNALTVPAAVACGAGASCTTSNMALLDFFQWRTSLASELPAGSGAVCLDATPDDGDAANPACDGAGTTFAVKVFWVEHNEASRLTVVVRP